MEDKKIVELYWQRKENAISETEKKYGRYLYRIAYNVLANTEDSQESVNDTYLKAWDTMPPNNPDKLSAYLGRITRFVSIDRLRKKTSLKRQTSQYAVALSELENLDLGNDIANEAIDGMILTEVINAFLKNLSQPDRSIFVGRYYFLDSIKDISGYTHISVSNVKVRLYRMRLELKESLEKEGIWI